MSWFYNVYQQSTPIVQVMLRHSLFCQVLSGCSPYGVYTHAHAVADTLTPMLLVLACVGAALYSILYCKTDHAASQIYMTVGHEYQCCVRSQHLVHQPVIAVITQQASHPAQRKVNPCS